MTVSDNTIETMHSSGKLLSGKHGQEEVYECKLTLNLCQRVSRANRLAKPLWRTNQHEFSDRGYLNLNVRTHSDSRGLWELIRMQYWLLQRSGKSLTMIHTHTKINTQSQMSKFEYTHTHTHTCMCVSEICKYRCTQSFLTPFACRTARMYKYE